MGGRGRGRGAGSSLNTEHLGLSRGDLPPAALSPPPLFPALLNKPTAIKMDEKEESWLRHQQRLTDQFKLRQSEVLTNINWNNLPKELKVGVKKRAARVVKPRIEKKPRPNLEETLKNLEAKEKTEKSDEEDADKKGENDSEDEEKKEAGEEEIEEEDEEMDGGTDYANNYFDNGEEDDEDDNLDEGGVF